MQDKDRPLAERGRGDAARMGRELAHRGWQPQQVLVSTAARTRQTWELVAGELGRPIDAVAPESLYLGSAETLLNEIREAPDTVTDLILVAHNPGLQELARDLAGPQSDRDALTGMGAAFPPAALARFVFDSAWAELVAGGATLTDLLRPGDLR